MVVAVCRKEGREEGREAKRWVIGIRRLDLSRPGLVSCALVPWACLWLLPPQVKKGNGMWIKGVRGKKNKINKNTPPVILITRGHHCLRGRE